MQQMTDMAAHEELQKLSARLAEVEATRLADRAELSALREEKRKTQMVNLSEGWFPAPGRSSFKLRSTEKDNVVDFMLKLSQVDDATNEHIMRLSENGEEAAIDRSDLLGEFSAILNSIPAGSGHQLNTARRSGSEGDSEAQHLSDDEQMSMRARKLADEKKIPFHEAAMQLAGRRIE